MEIVSIKTNQILIDEKFHENKDRINNMKNFIERSRNTCRNENKSLNIFEKNTYSTDKVRRIIFLFM